jgi:hypothetical protein
MSLRYDVAGISACDSGAPLKHADEGWYCCGFPSRPTSSLRPALNNANTRLITLGSVQRATLLPSSPRDLTELVLVLPVMDQNAHLPHDSLGPRALGIITPFLIVGILVFLVRIYTRVTPVYKLDASDYTISVVVVSTRQSR